MKFLLMEHIKVMLKGIMGLNFRSQNMTATLEIQCELAHIVSVLTHCLTHKRPSIPTPVLNIKMNLVCSPISGSYISVLYFSDFTEVLLLNLF